MTPAIDEARRLQRIAESDRDAFVVLKAAPHVRLSIVCFHAQQSIEKALKAVLTANGIPFRRIHDLDELARIPLNNGSSNHRIRRRTTWRCSTHMPWCFVMTTRTLKPSAEIRPKSW